MLVQHHSESMYNTYLHIFFKRNTDIIRAGVALEYSNKYTLAAYRDYRELLFRPEKNREASLNARISAIRKELTQSQRPGNEALVLICLFDWSLFVRAPSNTEYILVFWRCRVRFLFVLMNIVQYCCIRMLLRQEKHITHLGAVHIIHIITFA